MLVVADSSPFVGLIKIGLLDVLRHLYGSVVIPPEVAKELESIKRPAEVRAFIATPPEWLSIRQASNIENIEGLDEGELAAIALARELKADLLLIDETKGRQAAIERNLKTVRTAAVLFEAANAKALPDLKAAFDKLKATDFRVPHEALDELLRRHELVKQQQAERDRY
jgi:predicted nucleic acid-binding protein